MHDLLANHQDTRSGKFFANTDAAQQVHQLGINCKCDQLIVESPFSCITQPINFLDVVFCNEVYQKPYNFSYVAPLINIGLRGPPAVGITFSC